jgi:hypothetical protein
MPNTNNVWILDQSIPDIVQFSPALTSPETNNGGNTIWASSDGHLVTHARKTSDNQDHYYHWDPNSPSAWIDKGLTGGTIWDIYGTSYNNVWSVAGDAHNIRHFDGNTWTQDANPGGGRMVQVFATGTGEDEVFVASHRNVWFRRSGAIGSGVWVDHRAQMAADTGLDIAVWPPECDGVWAANKNEVYWLLRSSSNGPWHWVVKWTGPWPGSFAVVSTALVNTYGISDSSLDAASPTEMWWMQADPSWGQFRFVRFNGTNIERQTVEHNLAFGCELLIDQDDPTHGYAAGLYTGPYRIGVWEYNGGLNGWSLVTTKTVGLGSQSVGVALWVESIEFEESTAEIVTAVDTVTVETERFSADWLTYQENTEVWTDRTEPDGPKHEPPAVEEGGSGAIAYHASYHLIYYLLDPVGTNKPEFWIHKRLNNSWTTLQPQVFGTAEVDYPTWGSTDEAVAACWDGNNDRVLIYARRFSDDAPDFWAWDQKTFTRLTGSVTGLPTVTEPQLAWDPDTQTMWLYCYDAGIPGYRIYQLDTDTLTFTEKTVGGTEGTDYPAGRRRGCGFAYDPNLQELILSHGGVSPTLYSDTWSFNGTRWMRRTPSGIEGIAYPETRTRCSLVTGPNDDLYMVGGRSAVGVRLRDTWRWQGDLLNWEKKVADATSNEFIKPNMRTCGRWPVVPKKCQPPISYDFEFRSNEVVSVVDAVQVTP